MSAQERKVKKKRMTWTLSKFYYFYHNCIKILYQTPTGGSSEEFSAMGESLTEQYRVRDEGLRVVNLFFKEEDLTLLEE